MQANNIQIGVDIGGTKMLLMAWCEAVCICRQELTTGKHFSGADAAAAIDRFIQTLPTVVAGSCCQTIGIAVPGLVDDGKTIACDVLPNLVGWQPSTTLNSIYPIRVLNDAEAALIQVVKDLHPRSVVAVVMVGTGIGAAIAINGQMLRGAKGWAGELGSIPIDLTGATLDSKASGAAILQQLNIDADRLQSAIECQDPIAIEAIDRAGSALGLGLATLINLFDPEAIVLAGGTLRWQGYLQAAVQSAERLALPDLWAACNLQVSPHGGDLVALGAARSVSLDRENLQVNLDLPN
jgi:glucokinase